MYKVQIVSVENESAMIIPDEFVDKFQLKAGEIVYAREEADGSVYINLKNKDQQNGHLSTR
jgi:bifunctional DNA-binding transcriptional regulator/antitoxin component of YhaV-PrlF toxin-antitoxin module